MADPAPLRAGAGRPLLVLGALTAAVRVALFLCPGPDLSEAGRVMAEEVARGNTALEILRGPLLPLHEYQQPFWGGHIVVAMLAAPIFALLGPTLFALRLATLPFAILATCSAFAILDRSVGRRAAWIAGLLFALPPPGYLLLSCTAQGTHLESIALVLALVFLWLREREDPSTARVLGLGFTAGFSLWFGFLTLVPIALFLLAEFVEDRTFFLRKRFGIGLAAFGVGLAPWIHLNVLERGRGMGVYDKSAASWFDPGGLAARATSKFASLAREDFALSTWLPDSSAGSVGLVAAVLSALVVFEWLRAVVRARGALAGALRGLRAPRRLGREERFALVLMLAPSYLALYLASRFELGPRDWLQNLRYLMPLWAFLFLGVACTLGTGRAGASRVRLAAYLIVFGVAGARRADPTVFGRDLTVQAASTRGLARMIAWSQKHDREALRTAIARLADWPAAERAEFLFTLGKWFRFWSAPTTKLGLADEPRRTELDLTREELRRAVAPGEQSYFERPEPDERVDTGEDLAAFRARRGLALPP